MIRLIASLCGELLLKSLYSMQSKVKLYSTHFKLSKKTQTLLVIE